MFSVGARTPSQKQQWDLRRDDETQVRIFSFVGAVGAGWCCWYWLVLVGFCWYCWCWLVLVGSVDTVDTVVTVDIVDIVDMVDIIGTC